MEIVIIRPLLKWNDHQIEITLSLIVPSNSSVPYRPYPLMTGFFIGNLGLPERTNQLHDGFLRTLAKY
jgi:hypothetical protein